MLVEPNPSPYDVNFSLFGTHVRISATFWLFTAILGWSWVNQPNGLVLLLLWVLCAFFSILMHEFGHILVGRVFGAHGYVVLYSFGGLAVGSRDCDRRWQRIIVSLAGPGIQLLFYGALFLALRNGLARFIINDYAFAVVYMLLAINLWWPLLNLLPIWPLDGGMVTRDLCEGGLGASRGFRVSLIVSVVACGIVVVNSLAGMRGKSLIPYVPVGGLYAVILFGLLGMQSFQLLQSERGGGNRWDEQPPWEN